MMGEREEADAIPAWAVEMAAAAHAQYADSRVLDNLSTIIARALIQAEARGAERMKAEMQTDFVGWLRPWVKQHFGRWITYNTAKGAFNDFAAHQSAIRNLEAKDAG